MRFLLLEKLRIYIKIKEEEVKCYELQYILFAVLGVGIEVIARAISISLKHKNPRFTGTSTLTMFLIYGYVSFIVLFVMKYLLNVSIWIKGIIYMILIMAWEYISGWITRKLTGVAPWDYSKETKDNVGSPKRYSIHGLICLEYIHPT